MLAAVDEGIGQIAASLDKAGLRENTLIVFSADNGGPPPGNNTPLRDFKGTIYEGGVRGCAFATWPEKIPAGQRIKEPMHVIDWYPTLVKLAGGSLDQNLPIDGKDVWPMLTRQARSPHDAILSVKSPTTAALRMGDWKLVSKSAAAATTTDGSKGANATKNAAAKKKAQPTTGSIELYNLASDIGETTNLADKELDRVAAMQVRLAEFLKNAVPSGVAGGDTSE